MKKFLSIIFLSSLITQCIFDEDSKPLNPDDYAYTILSSDNTLSSSSQSDISSDTPLEGVSSSSVLIGVLPESSTRDEAKNSSIVGVSSSELTHIDQKSSSSVLVVSSSLDLLAIPGESSQKESSSTGLSSAVAVPASYIKHYPQTVPAFLTKGYSRKRTIQLQIPTHDSMSAVDSIYTSAGKVAEVHDLDFEASGQAPVIKSIWHWGYDSLESLEYKSIRSANAAPNDTMIKVRYHYDAYNRLIEKVFVGQGDNLNPIKVERVEAYIFPDQIYPNESLTFIAAHTVKREQQSRLHIMDNLGRITETHIADQDADMYRTELSYFYVGETNLVDSTAIYGRDGVTVSYANSYLYNVDGQLTDIDGSFNDQMCKLQFNEEGLPIEYVCRVITTDKITQYRLYEYF